MTKTRWLFSEGKREDALRRSGEAVAADPESAQAHYLHGTMQLAARQFPEATASFTEVLRLNPRAAFAQVQLSRLTLLSGDAASAVQYAQEATKNAPGSPIARFSLARGLLAQGQRRVRKSRLPRCSRRIPTRRRCMR